MELLFVVIGGAILGAIARYSLPHRDQHGAVLVPAVGTAVAAVVWVGLTWLGLAWDGGWIWLASLGAAAVLAVVVDLVVGRRRLRSDAQLLARLTSGRAAA